MGETGELYLGLISGTSADAVDAALVEVASPREGDFAARLLASSETDLGAALRDRVHRLARPETGASEDCLDELLALDVELADVFLRAARSLLADQGIEPERLRAVGHHGQTVRHRPPREAGEVGGTLQIGSAAILAESLGVPVVHDFRARDMALGGQGAPLVPLVDRLLLSREGEAVVALNLGGIANLTRVPPRGAPGEVLAFDTGPANCWLDAICRHADVPGGFDAGGERSRRGKLDEALLRELLSHPYFSRRPPKSTGLEEFEEATAIRLLEGRAAEDVLHTLVHLTARTVADGLRSAGVGEGQVTRVVVSGGGARNAFLMERLAAELPGVDWETPDERGVPGAAKEAFAFAVLAARTMHGLPGNLPSVTGASRETVLGSVALPPGEAPAS